MTMTSASSPKDEKYSRMLSGVVCQDSPPINIFPGSLGMSSPPPPPPEPPTPPVGDKAEGGAKMDPLVVGVTAAATDATAVAVAAADGDVEDGGVLPYNPLDKEAIMSTTLLYYVELLRRSTTRSNARTAGSNPTTFQRIEGVADVRKGQEPGTVIKPAINGTQFLFSLGATAKKGTQPKGLHYYYCCIMLPQV